MDISYKKLWKLLIDRDMKKRTWKRLRASATMSFPKWSEMKTSRLKPWEKSAKR